MFEKTIKLRKSDHHAEAVRHQYANHLLGREQLDLLVRATPSAQGHLSNAWYQESPLDSSSPFQSVLQDAPYAVPSCLPLRKFGYKKGNQTVVDESEDVDNSDSDILS
jgi:hypothetical protein